MLWVRLPPLAPMKEKSMWKFIWTFCGVYPFAYAFFAPFNLYMLLLSFFIALAWDLTNQLENAQPDPYED